MNATTFSTVWYIQTTTVILFFSIHQSTALHMAAEGGALSVVKFLHKKGANVNITECFGVRTLIAVVLENCACTFQHTRNFLYIKQQKHEKQHMFVYFCWVRELPCILLLDDVIQILWNT